MMAAWQVDYNRSNYAGKGVFSEELNASLHEPQQLYDENETRRTITERREFTIIGRRRERGRDVPLLLLSPPVRSKGLPELSKHAPKSDIRKTGDNLL